MKNEPHTEIYGSYKNIRSAAWHCLLNYKIHELPIDLTLITKPSRIVVHRNSRVNVLFEGELGAAYWRNEIWHVVYDDTKSVGMQRFTLAHELGHIFLGHEMVKGKHGRMFVENKPQAEKDADMFAVRLLAPACVLWAIGVESSGDIQQICHVSRSAAEYRSERMKELNKRNMYLSHPLERRVYEQFKGFIDTRKKRT